MDNLVIFSVVKDCVKQKENSFPIPKAMPKCTGKKCICGWFWLADQVSSLSTMIESKLTKRTFRG